MKRLFLILSVLFLPLLLRAQDKRIVAKSFQLDMQDARARTSAVYDNNNRLTALVEIVSTIGDKAFFEGIVGEPVYKNGNWLVRVAEGTSSIKITVPDFKQFEYSFPKGIQPEPGAVYKLDLDIEAVQKLRTLIMPVFSYNQSQMSFGLLLAVCKGWIGGYTKAKTDFTFGIKPIVDCDAEGRINGEKGWFTGTEETFRLSFTAGYMGEFLSIGNSSSLYGYVGGGYGSRLLAWEIYGKEGNYEYARVTPNSFTGFEAELGLVFRWNWITIMAGVQTNQFKYYEVNLGVGLMF